MTWGNLRHISRVGRRLHLVLENKSRSDASCRLGTTSRRCAERYRQTRFEINRQLRPAGARGEMRLRSGKPPRSSRPRAQAFQDEIGEDAEVATGVLHGKCVQSGKNRIGFATYDSVTTWSAANGAAE